MNHNPCVSPEHLPSCCPPLHITDPQEHISAVRSHSMPVPSAGSWCRNPAECGWVSLCPPRCGLYSARDRSELRPLASNQNIWNGCAKPVLRQPGDVKQGCWQVLHVVAPPVTMQSGHRFPPRHEVLQWDMQPLSRPSWHGWGCWFYQLSLAGCSALSPGPGATC